MKKKLLVGALGIAAIGALGVIAPSLVFAAADTGTPTEFVQRLATKLGLDVTTVQDAVSSVHIDLKAERDAARKTEIAQAVTAGKLTQRQADILIAMIDVMPELKANQTDQKPDLSGLTETQRKAKMNEMRTRMGQSIVDALNAKGLNTTLEEVQSTIQAQKDAGFAKGPGYGMGGPKGGLY
ncbi:MAG: hypothetical protein ABI721_01200 [Candidatus Dojkabacteria bacterium]